MAEFSSIDPASGEVVWSGRADEARDVDRAVKQARAAFGDWSRRPVDEREAHLRDFAITLEQHVDSFANLISREVGKPNWEALTEVRSMIGKAELSIAAYAQRCSEFTGGRAVTRFRPHGVVAVFGPFNFPGHLPNGHIMPALVAGNTVVFKPSEFVPAVGALMAELWQTSGLPAGVLTLVQGGRETGAALVEHHGIDGLFFTGSSRAGLWLAERFAQTPERILALEMGGNNPLVAWPPFDHRAAALLVVQSGFLTAGQRCTCARRLILPDTPEGNAFAAQVVEVAKRIRVGASTDRPEPFMGPVINSAAAQGVLDAQRSLIAGGGRSLLPARILLSGTGLISPGILDVTTVTSRVDEEIFGPLLQIVRVPDFEAAIEEANHTRFGLAAGLICDDASHYERFRDSTRAGIINWNQPLPGASGAAPFGGVGRSGNHRPAGFFSADYCSFPVASLEAPKATLPKVQPIGIDAS